MTDLQSEKLEVEEILKEIGNMETSEMDAFLFGVRVASQMIADNNRDELNKITERTEWWFCQAIDSEVRKLGRLAEKV